MQDKIYQTGHIELTRVDDSPDTVKEQGESKRHTPHTGWNVQGKKTRGLGKTKHDRQLHAQARTGEGCTR